MKLNKQLIAPMVLSLLVPVAHAGVFEDYESFSEGGLHESFVSNGLTYHDLNNVAGFYADGVAFTDTELGRDFIIENATDFYPDFPSYGSPINSLTFGDTYVVGNNLSIGVLASAWIDIDQLSNAASFDMAYYENGPWGGVEYHLDALLAGNVVASDSFTISDLGGRDNPQVATMSVSGADFDQLHYYATKNDAYCAPRAMIDNLSVTYSPVPEPATLGLLAFGALGFLRKRKA